MSKNYSKLLILLMFTTCLFTQTNSFNESEFIKTVRSRYHQMDSNNKDIITSDLTSRNFRIYLKSKTNEEDKFPLVLDWSKSDRINIKKSNFTIETDDYSTSREQLILLTRNFIVNWSEFAVKKQIPDSAMNYSFSTKEDRVFFSYVYPNSNGYHRISKEFGLNGILLKVEIQLQSKETIIMTPRFQTIGPKLLLYGWFYQKKDTDGNISEGNEVDIKYKIINDTFFPEDVTIKVQIAKQKNTVFVEQLMFRNYKLNDEEI